MQPTATLPPLIGQSPAFLAMLDEVSRVAALDRPVLVIGERGPGKERVAARAQEGRLGLPRLLNRMAGGRIRFAASQSH